MTITDEIGGARKKKDRLLHGVSLFRKKNNLQATSTYSLCPFLPFILSLFSLFRSSWWATTKPMAAWVKDARRQKPGETQTTGELTFEVEEGTKNKNEDQPIRKIPASKTTNCPPPPPPQLLRQHHLPRKIERALGHQLYCYPTWHYSTSHANE